MFESRRGRHFPGCLPLSDIDLQRWTPDGLGVLRALNTAYGKRHLGGPESEEKLRDRHARYLDTDPGTTEMLQVVAEGRVVGAVGYWTISRPSGAAYEIGWEIVAGAQGRGIGASATRLLLDRLAAVARHAFVFAFPHPDNAASNAICRRLGMSPLGLEDIEYPKGTISPHNVWRLDLSALRPRV